MKRDLFSLAARWMLIITLVFGANQLSAQSNIWVTAYYAGWQQGYLPPQNIDYTALTHIAHFALVPNANGTVDDQVNGVTAASASALISSAHAAGKKVLITVGGWATESAFVSATNGSTRATFVSNLVNLMRTRGYDGIDVDWEPLNSSDAANFTAFITDLRTALNAITPRPLLTMATQWTAPIAASVASQMDQINLMTYDLAGPWPGWVVWHNAATFDGGMTIGSQTISADGFVQKWNAAGVPLAKLGIGIDFYGYVWSGGDGTPTGGVTAPGQSWTTAPSVLSNVPYYTIMSDYFQSGNYRWDANAQAAYLSNDNPGSSSDSFITYDDEATCTAKVNYARSKHIGGVIIWELGGGYRPGLPAGQRDLLLQAVKQALGSTQSSDTTSPAISLTAPAGGTTVINTITVSANATDNVGVLGVQFRLDGTTLGSEVTTAPYSVSWNTILGANGPHTLSATARDAAGNTRAASISVTVANLSADTIPPAVSVTSPVAGATVTGTVNISATATDNVRVVGVQFKLDGSNLGSEVASAPYASAWNSASTANGTHTVTATARDSAGNLSTASVSVTVSNTVSSSSDLWVYQEALQSPWIDNSWSATVTFNTMEQKYAGTYAIKVVQGIWGSLSLRSGIWSSPVPVNPSQYQSVECAVYGGSSGMMLAMMFENDAANAFPRIDYGTIPANTWRVVSIPMSQLNPNNYVIHRLDILEISGVTKTYYVDNIRFVGTQGTGIRKLPGRKVSSSTPSEFALLQNYPNPFNPTTTISFDIPIPSNVMVKIYDVTGREVRTLVDEELASGSHSIFWDGTDEAGTSVASGTYICRMTAAPVSGEAGQGFSATRKLMLMK